MMSWATGFTIHSWYLQKPYFLLPFYHFRALNFGAKVQVVCLHLFLLRLGLCCHLSNSKHQAPPRRSSGSTKQPALMALSRAPFAKSWAVVPWRCLWCPWCPWCPWCLLADQGTYSWVAWAPSCRETIDGTKNQWHVVRRYLAFHKFARKHPHRL